MKANGIGFRLPGEQWRLVHPPKGSSFMAVHTGEHPRFVPSLMVATGKLDPEKSLGQRADELVAESAAFGTGIELGPRDQLGQDRLFQSFVVTLGENEQAVRVAQLQTMVRFPPGGDGRHPVIVFSLAAETDRVGDLLDDYHAFIASASELPTASSNDPEVD